MVLDDDLAGDLWAIGKGRMLLLRVFSELSERSKVQRAEHVAYIRLFEVLL